MNAEPVHEPDYLTVSEVAKILRVSPVTVANRFQNEPGVLNMSNGKNRMLRIPRHVLDRFIAEHSQKRPRFEPRLSWRAPRHSSQSRVSSSSTSPLPVSSIVPGVVSPKGHNASLLF